MAQASVVKPEQKHKNDSRTQNNQNKNSTYELKRKYWDIIIIITVIIIIIIVSCHRPFLSGNSFVPTVIPTAQASSFTLQYFPYYV
jgi:hypothetical protein